MLPFNHLRLFNLLVSENGAPGLFPSDNKSSLCVLLKVFYPLEYLSAATQHRSDLEDLF